MRIANALLLAVIFISTTASSLQTAASAAQLNAQQLHAIDSFVATQMAKDRIPGVAVGIYSRGTILLAKGYGVANVELNVLVKPETVFESGSVGKQFTAAAVMMLVQQGKLSLDDSITKYFPSAPKAWKPILIKNLLSHTSGIPDYDTPSLAGPTGPFYLQLDFTEDQLLRKIEALPVQWVPGEKWGYSNTNYVLLGILIHKVTGMPYGEFLKERIFEPLGMTSTRLINQRDIIPNRASGYEIDASGHLKNQWWVSPTFDSTADGSLYINVLDMAKWDAALYGTQLLSQSSLDRLWTIYRLNDGKPNPGKSGFGWWIEKQNNHTLIEYDGAWQGFTCDISRYPDDNLTVVVLTNLDAAHSYPRYIAHIIAGLANPALTPAKLAAIVDTQPEIAAILTKVLDQVVAGDDVRTMFAAPLAQTITPTAAEDAKATLSKLWPGGSLTLVNRIQRPGANGPEFSAFRLSKGNEAVIIVLSIGPNGKISLFRIMPNREYQ